MAYKERKIDLGKTKLAALILGLILCFWLVFNWLGTSSGHRQSLASWVQQNELHAQSLAAKGKLAYQLPRNTVYHPAAFQAKRDPFHSFVTVVNVQKLGARGPNLQAPLARRYPVSEIRLVGFLSDGSAHGYWLAVCVTPKGKTFLVRDGDLIGRRPNRVLEIRQKTLGKGYMIVRHPYVIINGKLRYHNIRIRQS